MSFACPVCAAVSHNPNDEREGYCGRCHDWTARETLSMWTIYRRPRDMPGVEWCIRRWRVLPGVQEPQPDVLVFPAETLAAARALIPLHLTRLPRQPDDDPAVVETWL